MKEEDEIILGQVRKNLRRLLQGKRIKENKMELRPVEVIIESRLGESKEVIKGFFHKWVDIKHEIGQHEHNGPAILIEKLDGFVVTIELSESVSVQFTDTVIKKEELIKT